MASLKDTKRRIGSVKNTQKITRAMKLVASAKYAKANVNLAKAKPYAESFHDLVQKSLASGEISSPLLEEREQAKKTRLIIISADRGLCGPLNSAVLKAAGRFLKEKGELSEVSVELWGKRAVMFGSSLEEEIVDRREKVLDNPNHPFAKKAFDRLSRQFLSGELDEVFVAYPSFQSALSQPPVIKPLLPLSECIGKAKESSDQGGQCIFEPELSKMVTPLLTKFGALSLYQFLLEAATAEHAARVAAMDSATTNANKVIKELTLEYNRARQAAITKELIEITSGAEALN